MAKVLAHTTMSLDGFIAGPNDEMDWVFEHADDVPAALVDEVIATTSAVLGATGRPQSGAARDEQAVRWALERADLHPHARAAKRRDGPGIHLRLG